MFSILRSNCHLEHTLCTLYMETWNVYGTQCVWLECGVRCILEVYGMPLYQGTVPPGLRWVRVYCHNPTNTLEAGGTLSFEFCYAPVFYFYLKLNQFGSKLIYWKNELWKRCVDAVFYCCISRPSLLLHSSTCTTSLLSLRYGHYNFKISYMEKNKVS